MRICVIYPIARWLTGLPCGGAEKQIGLLAEGWTRHGHEVMVIASEYRDAPTSTRGVLIRAPWNPDERVSRPRALACRYPDLTRLLRRANADLYYLRGAQIYSRWSIAGGHAVDAPVLLGLASDRNLQPEAGRMILSAGHRASQRPLAHLAWLALQRPALRAADVIIAQTEAQATQCARMRLPHALIPSIVEVPSPDLLERPQGWDVAWAGNAHGGAGRDKGVAIITELARALPRARFVVVGTLSDGALVDEVRRLSTLANVTVLGPVEYGRAQEVLASSRLVLNTSPTEGFSNVMLEGWALGKPSLALNVNPNQLLADRAWPPTTARENSYTGTLGSCAGGDVSLLARLIDAALQDNGGRERVGAIGQAYVADWHAADAVCARYEAFAALPAPRREA